MSGARRLQAVVRAFQREARAMRRRAFGSGGARWWGNRDPRACRGTSPGWGFRHLFASPWRLLLGDRGRGKGGKPASRVARPVCAQHVSGCPSRRGPALTCRFGIAERCVCTRKERCAGDSIKETARTKCARRETSSKVRRQARCSEAARRDS